MARNIYKISGRCQIHFGNIIARDRLCYNCKKTGHISRECTKPRLGGGSSGGVRGGGRGKSGGSSKARGSDRGRGGGRGRSKKMSRPRSPSRSRSPFRRPSRSRRSGSSVASTESAGSARTTDQTYASAVRDGIGESSDTTRKEVIEQRQPPANTE